MLLKTLITKETTLNSEINIFLGGKNYFLFYLTIANARSQRHLLAENNLQIIHFFLDFSYLRPTMISSKSLSTEIFIL
jgi:hypothetical protein